MQGQDLLRLCGAQRMIMLKEAACSSPGEICCCASALLEAALLFSVSMRNNIASKFLSHPGLQLSRAFPLPFPVERTTHPLVLVLSSMYLQLLSPPVLPHEALPALKAAAERARSSWPQSLHPNLPFCRFFLDQSLSLWDRGCECVPRSCSRCYAGEAGAWGT